MNTVELNFGNTYYVWKEEGIEERGGKFIWNSKKCEFSGFVFFRDGIAALVSSRTKNQAIWLLPPRRALRCQPAGGHPEPRSPSLHAAPGGLHTFRPQPGPASQAANPHPVIWPPKMGSWGPHVPKGDTWMAHSRLLKHTAGTWHLAWPLARAEEAPSRAAAWALPAAGGRPFPTQHSRAGLDGDCALLFILRQMTGTSLLQWV